MRILALAAALLAIAPPAVALIMPPLGFTATPVPLDERDRAHVRVGGITYLGGWVLRSDDRRFGGISSMTLQGGRLAALSDTGMVFWLRPAHGTVTLDAIQPLPTGPGGGGSMKKEDRDSESSAYDPATRRIWVGFEGANAIWRYSPSFAGGEAHSAPKPMARWPSNTGAEAIVRLRDGRFLVFEEEHAIRSDGANSGIVFEGDPALPTTPYQEFGYRPPSGFAITDGLELPDGRVLLLHRRFSITTGAEAALTIFDPRTIQEGKAISGREVARLSQPLTVDNMEAIALVPIHGRIELWIASDDNFNAVQRTLLLRFALDAKL